MWSVETLGDWLLPNIKLGHSEQIDLGIILKVTEDQKIQIKLINAERFDL